MTRLHRWLGITLIESAEAAQIAAQFQGSAHHRARSALSPYRGLQRYHHLLGIAAGVVILWWLMSGRLSLDQHATT